VTTAQDLLSDLGPPLRTFYKEDDRMAIHARSHSEDQTPEPSCTPTPRFFLPLYSSMPSVRFLQLFSAWYRLPSLRPHTRGEEDYSPHQRREYYLPYMSFITLFLA
jgi:hypothetical protein